MRIVLQYFEGCPNWKLTEQRLREALVQSGLEAEPLKQLVESHEQAQRLGFRGSPTILIDGLDPFAEEAPEVGLSCRVYRTEQGLQGSPTTAQLRAAVLGRRAGSC
jgi:hypothetical protein